MLLILAAAIGVHGLARGLAMASVSALFGGPFSQIYTGAVITVAGVTWLGCVGVAGVKALRSTPAKMRHTRSPKGPPS